MIFEQHYVDRENYFEVGIDKDTGDYVLAVTITWIAWYTIFFKITKEEYEWVGENYEKLANLANDMAHDKGVNVYKDRLIKNEGRKLGGS